MFGITSSRFQASHVLFGRVYETYSVWMEHIIAEHYETTADRLQAEKDKEIRVCQHT